MGGRNRRTPPQEIPGSPVTVDGAMKKTLQEMTVRMLQASVPHISEGSIEAATLIRHFTFFLSVLVSSFCPKDVGVVRTLCADGSQMGFVEFMECTGATGRLGIP